MGTRAWQTIALKTLNAPLRTAEEHSVEEATRLATALKGNVIPIKECLLSEAFQDASSLSGKIAVGAYKSGYVILNFDIANDLVFGSGKTQKIIETLASPDTAAIVAHSVSSSWGYAIYKNRTLLRASAGGDGEWILNQGPALPEFEPELIGMRVEKMEDGGHMLPDMTGDDEASEYDIGDSATNLITDHYLHPDLWYQLRCTLFDKRGLLFRLFGI